MKCFNHHQSDAVGVCKSCSRALCPDCVAEFEEGIACKGKCEELVQALNLLVAKNASLAPVAATPWLRNAWLYLALGAVFLYAGLVELDRPIINFMSLVGGLMTLAGVSIYLWGRRIRGAPKR
jgi:hypothetical protein